MNEAALVAARRSHTAVQMADFTDALERLVLGTARRIVQSAEDLQRTAYHESGHALIGMLTPGADPVRKISIVPRGHALGVTFQAPDIERYGYSSSYLEGRIAGMLGGRAAEQLIYGDTTTGAENDMEQATSIARPMWDVTGHRAGVGAAQPGARAADGLRRQTAARPRQLGNSSTSRSGASSTSATTKPWICSPASGAGWTPWPER